MGGESNQTFDKELVQDLVSQVQPNSCFDVGIGDGKMMKLVKGVFPECTVIGFEVFLANIKPEEYNGAYDSIQHTDFYKWIENNNDWEVDLIVFGDVLEHFMKSKVIDILDLCRTRCKWIIAKIPLNYKQHSIYGNLYEGHLSEISLQDLDHLNIVHYLKKEIDEWSMTYYLIRGGLNLDTESQFKHKFPEISNGD